MRIIDTKDPHTLFDPECKDALELYPKLLPSRRLKVERIDILILFGRVLRVLNCSVGTLLKPLLVFFHVRVVGRHLERDVEGDLHAHLARPAHETSEFFERPQLRKNRFVTALFGANCPWTSHIAGLCLYVVVLPLTKFRSNRMNRRQINNIESHSCDVW